MFWHSSNNEVALVNDGIVKLLQPGEAIITCSNNLNTDTCTFIVEDKKNIDSNLDIVFYELDFSKFNNENNTIIPNYIEIQPTITGKITKEENKIILDGTQSLTTNGIYDKHKFGTSNTIGIQIIRYEIKLLQYPDSELELFSGLKINSNGFLMIKNNNTNIRIELNNDIILCYLCGNIKNIGWKGCAFLSTGEDSGLLDNNAIWGTDFTIPLGLKAEIKNIKLFNTGSLSSEESFYNDEFKNKIIQDKFDFVEPTISKQTRKIENEQYDNSILNIKLTDNNEFKFKNYNENIFDIEELDNNDYIIDIKPLSLKYGDNQINLKELFKNPRRYLRHFRIKDKYNNNYVNLIDISICKTSQQPTTLKG